MKILAIDPAKISGWAFSDGQALACGRWDLGPTLGERPGALAANIRAAVKRFGCDVLAYEVATFGGTAPHVMRAMNELSGAIQAVGSELGLTMYAFGISSWKARAVGKGNAKKWGVKRGLELYHGLKIDNEDEADAVGILKAAEMGPPPLSVKKQTKAIEKKLKATQPLLFGRR